MTTTYRVLVCGGRDYEDKTAVYTVLNQFVIDFGPIEVLIEGEATGADRLARLWAEQHRVTVISCPADWSNISAPGAVIRIDKHGRRYNAAAGPMRNARMLREHAPDVVIAFPGHEGTRNMVSLARQAGVQVFEIDY